MRRAIWLLALLVAGCGSSASGRDCSQENGGCHPNAICTMWNDLAVCDCKPGFAGDGIKSCEEMLVVTAPAEGVVVSMASPDSLTLSGTSKGATKVEYRIDGGAAQALATGSFSVSIALAEEDGVLHTLEVAASGEGGKTSKVTRKYTVDRVAPTVTIETPVTDGACADTCTGAVVDASMSSLSFKGRAQDGAGLPVDTGLVATVGDQPVSITRTDADWSGSWQNIPADPGAEFVFTITATDPAGNETRATRKVWVDRVAPVCTLPQSGKRLVSRTAVLVQCSEPMNVATVSATFTPALATSLTSTDGKSFKFADGNTLEPYELYSLSLAAGAKDRVGNAVAAESSGRFLTEIALPPAEVAMALGGEGGGQRLAVDADGRPSVIALTGTAATGRHVLGTRWDGKAAWEKFTLPMQLPACAAVPSNCPAFRVADYRVNSKVGADLALSVEYELLLLSFASSVRGHELRYAHSTDFLTWGGLASATPDLLFNPMESGWDSYSFLREYASKEPSTGVLSQLNNQIVIRRKTGTGGWTAPIRLGDKQPVPYRALQGNAAVLPNKAFDQFHLMPTDTVLPFAASDKFDSAEPWRGTDSALVGSAMLAWAKTAPVGTTDRPAFHVGCSGTPDSPSSWKESGNLTPVRADLVVSETPNDVRLSLGERKVAVALHLLPTQGLMTKGRIFFGVLENVCKAAPEEVRWSAAITEAFSPDVAVASDGTVWRAWLDVTNDLVIAH